MPAPPPDNSGWSMLANETWLVAMGTAIGGAFKWLWDAIRNQRASREAKIDAREDEYVTKLEARIELLEKAQRETGFELERHRISIALLISDVARHDPKAPVLDQVRQILGLAFPIKIPTPADIADLATRIE